MKKGDLKSEGNKVMWWNGEKWLIKETCASEDAAQELLEFLKNRDGRN